MNNAIKLLQIVAIIRALETEKFTLSSSQEVSDALKGKVPVTYNAEHLSCVMLFREVPKYFPEARHNSALTISTQQLNLVS